MIAGVTSAQAALNAPEADALVEGRARHPRPPGPRWRDYERRGLNLPRGLSHWQIPVLVLRDRHGATTAERLQALRYRHFATARWRRTRCSAPTAPRPTAATAGATAAGSSR